MATSLVGAAVPLGFDSGLPYEDEDTFHLSTWEEMTAETVLDQFLETWDCESPNDTYSSLAASDTAKSPGRQSQQNSYAGASSSLSPGASLILTPTSTLLDYHGEATVTEDPEASDHFSSSAESNISPSSDDYVHIRPFSGQPGVRRDMSNRPPPALGSEARPSPSRQARDTSIAPSVSVTHSQWPSFNPATTTGGWMDQQNAGHFGSLNFPASYAFDSSGSATGDPLDDHLLPPYDSFTAAGGQIFDTALPFRSTNDLGQGGSQSPFALGSPLARQSILQAQQQALRPTQYDAAFIVPQGVPQGFAPQPVPSHNTPLPDLQATTHSARQQQHQRPFAAVTSAQAAYAPVQHAYVAPPQPYPQPTLQRQQHLQIPQTRPRYQRHPQAAPIITVVPPSRRVVPLAPGSSRPGAVASAQLERDRRKGGRQKGKQLAVGVRSESHKMRKTGACWRCIFQRDKCPDDGTPCKRCHDHMQKGQVLKAPCDRSKLNDFGFEFLPPSMTLMHQKQTIEDCVHDQVLQWDLHNPVDVYLTSGYGPALRWKLYEFKPRTPELLGQFQYLQDTTTGASVRYQKYSPPFGLAKLDTSDDSHFETYMDRLLHPQHLWEFGWTCFEEETQIDDFQARLLDLVCTLYMQTQDYYDLKELLQKIIRMMIITYIMGHTLTIEENTAYGVVDAIRHSQKPIHIPQHTSPRLANRQLKFFFCVLRNQVYENILNWQQQTLHSSGKKDATWLPAFCVMLGFAMGLEEVQRTIHIQADAKAQKGETTADEATTEAMNACKRIDERFNLLVGLFQMKYRDRKWTHGSFGNGTPELRDPVEVNFLAQLYVLLLEKREHLQSRKDVQLAPENQCRYTSRLVARFLLPFLDLPA